MTVVEKIAQIVVSELIPEGLTHTTYIGDIPFTETILKRENAVQYLVSSDWRKALKDVKDTNTARHALAEYFVGQLENYAEEREYSYRQKMAVSR